MAPKRSLPVVLFEPQVGGTSIAIVKTFQNADGITSQYKQYCGRDAPPIDLGMSGDMYIDTSPNAYRLFIRYESWKEWPGVYRGSPSREFQFPHPVDKTKTVWCSPTDVLWYKKSSIYMGKRGLFLRYPSVSFVSAGELIDRTGLLSRLHAYVQTHVASSANFNPASTPTSVHTTLSSKSSYIPNTGDSLPPFTHNQVSSSSSRVSMSSSARGSSNIHDTHQISPMSSPSNPQQPVQVISRHERIFESATKQVTQYIVYHGLGHPSIDLGRPGDMFVDVTPNTYRVFVRYESWREWPGIYDGFGTTSHPLVRDFTHPQDNTRVVWCTQSEVMWYKNTSLRCGRLRLFSSKPYIGASFVSAHKLITRSGIPERAGVHCLQLDDGSTGAAENTKKRKIETERERERDHNDSAVANSEDIPSSSCLQSLSAASASSVTAVGSAQGHSRLPTRTSISPSPDIALGSTLLQTEHQLSTASGESLHGVSRGSSVLSELPPGFENQISTSPLALESSNFRSPSPNNEDQNLDMTIDGIDDVDYAGAARAARQSARLKEQYGKRKTKYLDRKMKLTRREAELAKQQDELEEEIRRARLRLKEAKQDAISRSEEAKRRDEELQRQKAEVIALENRVFRQEQALRKQKEIIEKMQGSISLWEQV